MSDIIDAIAAALNGRGNYPLGSDLRPEAERVLAALRERYAIVELPKPDEGWFDQWLGGDVHLDTTSEYVLQEPYNHGEIIWHTPSQARKLAAALLAATDKAKEGK